MPKDVRDDTAALTRLEFNSGRRGKEEQQKGLMEDRRG